MMRAGRRSVEEALDEARTRADVILTAAERDAEERLTDANKKAKTIRAAAEEEAHRQEETVEIRRIEVAALDEEIEMRQSALRTAAAELLLLADGIDDTAIDLRESDGESSTDADESLTT